MDVNDKKHFIHKNLLIFSAICVVTISLGMLCLGLVLNIKQTVEYNVFGLLMILIPLVTHIYIWGIFFEYKKKIVLCKLFKIGAILVGLVIIFLFVAYLFGF